MPAGYTCSKIFNIVLSVTLTRHVINPFGVVDEKKVRSAIKAVSFIAVTLHISDFVIVIIALTKFAVVQKMKQPYVVYVCLSSIPGFLSAMLTYCAPADKEGEVSGKCDLLNSSGDVAAMFVVCGLFFY